MLSRRPHLSLWQRLTVYLLALWPATHLLACQQATPPPQPAEALALSAPLTELPAPYFLDPEAYRGASFEIRHEPSHLQVYRATAVTFSVTLPTGHEGAQCRWSFSGLDDDDPQHKEGCEIQHTFMGGQADERASVTITSRGKETRLTQIIPLERLPVSARAQDTQSPHDQALPSKGTAPTAFRVAIISDTISLDATHLAKLRDRLISLDADFVIHLGDHTDDSRGWQTLRDQLGEGLRAHDIPLLPAVSPDDLALGAEVRRPLGRDDRPLTLQDGAAFPARWTFSHEGAYFVFISGTRQDDDAISWLRDRLQGAQIYESRLVFSQRPLEPFTGATEQDALLSPRFKLYELLLRARTTALFSASEGVYFKGRYGALPVVSVGSARPRDAQLLGLQTSQPPSLTVMDLEDGLPQRVFALSDPAGTLSFDTLILEETLPETVGVYTQ